MRVKNQVFDLCQIYKQSLIRTEWKGEVGPGSIIENITSQGP